jgi:hypothetical protein
VKVRGEKWTDGTVRANTINVNKDRGGGNNDDVTP